MVLFANSSAQGFQANGVIMIGMYERDGSPGKTESQRVTQSLAFPYNNSLFGNLSNLRPHKKIFKVF